MEASTGRLVAYRNTNQAIQRIQIAFAGSFKAMTTGTCVFRVDIADFNELTILVVCPVLGQTEIMSCQSGMLEPDLSLRT
jgi:hypothetical protein